MSSPRQWLLVLDWLWDNEQRPHEFVQRFHFAPHLQVDAIGDGRLSSSMADGGQLNVVPLSRGMCLPPVRGQELPPLGLNVAQGRSGGAGLDSRLRRDRRPHPHIRDAPLHRRPRRRFTSKKVAELR